MAKKWTMSKVGGQTGKVAVVTGSNTGLGYETALALAGKSATTILACRSLAKAETAKKQILEIHPNAVVDVLKIDTGSFKSVRNFAETFLKNYKRLDLLINNAGIMIPPYNLTEDGLESQFGVNYMGHFLLTGLLLPLINKTEGARIVNLGSTAYKYGGIQFDDINFEKKYDAKKAYGQSKTACIVFTYELQRRLSDAGYSTISVTAHPGYAATNLSQNLSTVLKWLLMPFINKFISQSPAAGALSVLYAALGDDINGGDFAGPSGFCEVKGVPTKVSSPEWTYDCDLGKKLWKVSEEITGLKYKF
jgi:NAD(P)-dependent dehydrogenase (short-subunit alcohol dehydrogenase family)